MGALSALEIIPARHVMVLGGKDLCGAKVQLTFTDSTELAMKGGGGEAGVRGYGKESYVRWGMGSELQRGVGYCA